jgi:hypothetical protein
MLLKLTVFDARNTIRGNARMKLDFGAKMWSIEDDPQQVWQRVASLGRVRLTRRLSE